MAMQRAEEQNLPTFQSLEEEAMFWDTHSPLDYPGEWSEADDITIARPLTHILAVRLDAPTIRKLAAVGRQKGIGPSTLARIWLLERLDAADGRE